MLFALRDYCEYRRRSGRYSDHALRGVGLRKAVAEEFPGWRQLPLGTLLFAHTAKSFLSWSVMYLTNSVLSHVAMVYGDGVVHDVTTAGVMRHSIANYFDNASYIQFKPCPVGADLQCMRVTLDSNLGHRFNWLGVLKLGAHIVIANHTSFRWRLAGDILFVTLLITALTAALSPGAVFLPATAAILYLAIVIFNRTCRRRAIEQQFEVTS